MKTVELTIGTFEIVAKYEVRNEETGEVYQFTKYFKYYSEARTWALDHVNQDESKVTVIRPE